MDFVHLGEITTGLIMILFYVIKSGVKEETWNKYKGWVPALATVIGLAVGLTYAKQNGLPLFNLDLIWEAAKNGLAAVAVDQIAKRTPEAIKELQK